MAINNPRLVFANSSEPVTRTEINVSAKKRLGRRKYSGGIKKNITVHEVHRIIASRKLKKKFFLINFCLGLSRKTMW